VGMGVSLAFAGGVGEAEFFAEEALTLSLFATDRRTALCPPTSDGATSTNFHEFTARDFHTDFFLQDALASSSSLTLDLVIAYTSLTVADMCLEDAFDPANGLLLLFAHALLCACITDDIVDETSITPARTNGNTTYFRRGLTTLIMSVTASVDSIDRCFSTAPVSRATIVTIAKGLDQTVCSCL